MTLQHARLIVAIGIVTLHIASVHAADPTPEGHVRATVQAWNDAHATRDVAALSRLYAAEVSFYGTTMPKEECIARKKRFFDQDPKFTQSIAGDVTVEKRGAGYMARFTKKVVAKGTPSSYPSYLLIDELEGEDAGGEKGWKVIVESDTVTDDNIVKRERAYDPKRFKTCEDALLGLFKSCAKIRDAITSTQILELEMPESRGDPYVLHAYALPPLLHMTQTSGWYDFDPATKKMTDTMSGDELRYDRDLLPHVARLCP